MIDRTHELPIVRQCQILELARLKAYYQPISATPEELSLTFQIDEMHLGHPFAGARMLSKMLKRAGNPVGQHRVTLIKRMGINALYRKSNTRKRHLVYPYLLRNLIIASSNQVWAPDITYIPMKRGLVYLFAVLDWASRRMLSWRLSITLTTELCIEAVQEAMNKHSKPEIFNTDHGCQFTSMDFTGLLKENGIRISMDGKGCRWDKVFEEWLWKSVKYEEAHIHAYDYVSNAKKGLEKYFAFYNQRRPHTALDDKMPDEFYFENLPALPKAA